MLNARDSLSTRGRGPGVRAYAVGTLDEHTGPSIPRAAGLTGALALLAVAIGGAAITPDWRTPLERAGIRFISARELHGMLTRGELVTLVDARDEVHYRRAHLPGAISIPAEDAPLRFIDLKRPKRLLHPERLPVDRARRLVFYCGGPN